MVFKKNRDEEKLVGGRERVDPRVGGLKGGKKKDRDKWWGYDDPVFKRWYHKRKKKQRGYRNVDLEEEMKKYYEEWLSLGKPDA